MALTDNLLAYYKLDESSGNASDSTGNGQTLVNTNTVAYAAALINNGADFGATNTNKVLVKNTTVGYPNGAQPGSISLWTKIRTAPSSGGLAELGDMRSPNGLGLHLRYGNSAGTLQLAALRDSDSFANNALVNITLSTSAFTHCVCSYDGSAVSLYINGVFQTSVASTSTVTGTAVTGFATGDVINGPAIPLSAFTDEIGIWSRGITSTEVTQLYNGGIGLTYPFATGNTASFVPELPTLKVG